MSIDTCIPATQNESFGFHGTMGDHASVAWPLAFDAIRRMVKRPAIEVRAFLDAPAGRHFADEVLDGLDRGRPLGETIETVASRWMCRVPANQRHGQHDLGEGKSLLLRLVIEAGEYAAACPEERQVPEIRSR